MRIAVIGRSEILYEMALLLENKGHEISCIITSREAPEYERTARDYAMLSDHLNTPFGNGSKIVEFSELIKDSQSDIAVSFNYTGIIPQDVIDMFPLGILNAHGGDLPRYRGNACQAWAILKGEERIGLCVHKMIGGELDSGDIITRDYMRIDHSTKVTKVWEWMSLRIPLLFLEAVEKLEADPSYILEIQSDSPENALRCYPRRPEDGRISWSSSAIDVLRLINASNKPYGGAFCEFEGRDMIVWDAELVLDNEIFCAVPGQITNIGEEFIEVACGNGKLRLLEIEIDGVAKSPHTIIKSIRKRLS
jgi:methionyl-tRNA formyltransferase